MSKAQIRTIEEDVDRVIMDWFWNHMKPGDILENILLKAWKVSLRTTNDPGKYGWKYSVDEKSISVDESLSDDQRAEAVCEAWVALRVHTLTGRPVLDSERDFVEEWVEQYFLPEAKVEKSTWTQYVKARRDTGQGEDLDTYASLLAEEFGCTEELVKRALGRRANNLETEAPWVMDKEIGLN